MLICPNCKTTLTQGASDCAACGALFAPDGSWTAQEHRPLVLPGANLDSLKRRGSWFNLSANVAFGLIAVALLVLAGTLLLDLVLHYLKCILGAIVGGVC
jgi:hypothetical protein